MAADAELDLVLAKVRVESGKAPTAHLRRALATYLERGAWDRVIRRQVEIIVSNTDRSSDN
jgi:hypothetical protein